MFCYHMDKPKDIWHWNETADKSLGHQYKKNLWWKVKINILCYLYNIVHESSGHEYVTCYAFKVFDLSMS